MIAKEYVDKLLDLWGENNTQLAYEIASLYSSGDYRLISEVMDRFHESIETLYMCV